MFGGESEKLNKKMKMRGKRELNRNAMWSVTKFVRLFYVTSLFSCKYYIWRLSSALTPVIKARKWLIFLFLRQ